MSYSVAARAAGRGVSLKPLRQFPESRAPGNLIERCPTVPSSPARRGAGRGKALRSGSLLNDESVDKELAASVEPARNELTARALRRDMASRTDLSVSVLDSRQNHHQDDSMNRFNSRRGAQNRDSFRKSQLARGRRAEENADAEMYDGDDGFTPTSRKTRDSGNLGGRRRSQSKSHDWFSSISRIQAMKTIELVSKAASSSKSRTAESPSSIQVPETNIPFAGGSFAHLTSVVPEKHWVSPFLKQFTGRLESNPYIDPAEKYNIVKKTVETVTSLDPSAILYPETSVSPIEESVGQDMDSLVDDDSDPRYQDAEPSPVHDAVA